MSSAASIEQRAKQRSLFTQLAIATRMVDEVAMALSSDQRHWQRTILGHNFSVTRANCQVDRESSSNLVNSIRTWLYAHEDAQVMLGSLLVVVGVWWLVRAVLTLVINLVCPLLVVLLAVVCVPQLRGPLLGQNYPVLANLMRSILLRMAENIKTS